MKFKFVGNACGIFIGDKKTKILCDPWVVNGVFEGSWYHYPPLKTKLKDFNGIDAIYLSHIHPDHYDERNFKFSKKTPIILLDQQPNFLKKNLIAKGYENIIGIKNNESTKFKEFELTIYKPFTGHIFEESLLGNLIDSAIVLKNNNNIAINFNDNTPDLKACKYLHKKFKKIDIAMLNYNAAGPYPSCFENLNEEEKLLEHKRLLKRNFDHLCSIIPYLKPKSVLPFAGSYILGGKNYYKNKYLGTTTWDECATYLKRNLKYKTKVICLNENQIFDTNKLKINTKYKKINKNHQLEYIKKISKYKYDYENEKPPNKNKLLNDILLAKKLFLKRIKKFNISLKTNVYISIYEKNIKIINGKDPNKFLFCIMDNRLLRRILDKKSHWNNAEIGTHIRFIRVPNKMEPDVHTSLSFFHL